MLALLGGVFIDCFNDSRLHFGLIAQLAIYFTALFCMHGLSWRVGAAQARPAALDRVLFADRGGAVGRRTGGRGGAAAVLHVPGMAVRRGRLPGAGVRNAHRAGAHRRKWLVRDLCYGSFAFVAVVGFGYAVLWPYWLHQPSAQTLIGSLDRARNFFGVVSVTQENLSDSPADRYRLLVNGRIRHGCQFVDPSKRHIPTSYYGEPSGVGLAIRHLQKAGPIRIGAIGLGTGTVAAYARPGDTLVFYEINPEVVRMARQYFTYLNDCRGQLQVVMGDARLSLVSELGLDQGGRHAPKGRGEVPDSAGAVPPHALSGGATPGPRFDILVVDAFSGDAIPTHLLTREALDIYRRRLAPHGVVAFHVSNTYLRLTPVVRRLADDCGMLATRIDHSPTLEENGNCSPPAPGCC